MPTGDRTPLTPEQQLAHMQQQLVHAQKLTALGTLVGTTTHEFNNVLTTIINYAKIGMRQTDVESRTKAFDKILAAGQRAAKLTNGILGFARNRSAGLEATDLQKLVDDTLVLLERELQKHRVSWEVNLAPVPRAQANANQIQQVLMNLIINAWQAMPGGGRLVVGLKHDAEHQMIELSVRDSGCGMPPDVLHRIFDPFFTTKSGPDASGKGGTGLGLAACLHIIESHRGKIRVESAPGKGTVFTIKLPVASVPLTAVSTDVPATPFAPGAPPMLPAITPSHGV